MSSVNKVILVGRLGKDPELRHIPNGEAVCSFSIATSERWKGKDGEAQEKTEWHNITVWGKRAEICAKYLVKGRQVYIEGKLQTDKYQDKATQETKYSTKVVALDVQFLGDAHKQDGAAEGFQPSASTKTDSFGAAGDDIPF